jgi:glycosyltransferase involved in cell wall biosynthesis
MKILFCPTHYIFDDGERGSELSWAYQIANNMASKYPESVVVTGFNNTKTKKKYKIIELQTHKKTIDLSVKNALKFNGAYTKLTQSILKKARFDILHHVLPFSIDTTFNLSFTSPATKKLVKIIGPIQSPLPFYKDNLHDYKASSNKRFHQVNRLILQVSKPILKYLSTRTLKNADKIIAINEETKNMLTKRGIDSNKIIIIPPGVDCRKFKPQNKKPIKKTIELLSVGALIERKGFDVLIKGIGEVIKKNKNIKVRILGDGPQKNNLKALVRQLSLENFIIFEGHIPHEKIMTYYKKADIFISTSRAESWGQMYLEAMSCGLPIISTINIGSKNIIKNNKFGFLISQEDYHNLADKIKYLIVQPKVLKEFAKQARFEVKNKYDWDKLITKKYINLYKDLINEYRS